MLSLLSPLAMKLIGGAVVLVLVGGGAAYWSVHEFNKGYAKCVADVAVADAAALARTKAGQADINKCRASGGTWSVVTGSCQ